jgi:CMP-N-acetylneuraminic acid synthetase
MKALALVPARCGSKGVIRKNIRLLAGKPLLAYTIEVAQQINDQVEIVVTTDCDEIAKVACDYGAEVIMRDAGLSDDKALMPPVALHALDTLASQGRRFEQLMLLQPTCPFRRVEHVRTALELLSGKNVTSVISVSDVGDAHPARMYRLNEERLVPLEPAWEHANRQDLPKIYRRNGLIYAVKTDVFRQLKTFFVPGSIALPIDSLYSVNIDEMIDFYLAEVLLENKALDQVDS